MRWDEMDGIARSDRRGEVPELNASDRWSLTQRQNRRLRMSKQLEVLFAVTMPIQIFCFMCRSSSVVAPTPQRRLVLWVTSYLEPPP